MSDFDEDDFGDLFSEEELLEQQRTDGGGAGDPPDVNINPYAGFEWLGDFLEEQGLPSDYEIFVQFDNINPADLRAKTFPDLRGAVNYLSGIGILGISKILIRNENGRQFFNPVVPESSDSAAVVPVQAT